MKATLTSKGQITIPVKIRKKLGLEPGQVLDFDEEAPFLKAIPVFDEDGMRAVRGCARGRLGATAAEWLEETRGPVSLPRANRRGAPRSDRSRRLLGSGRSSGRAASGPLDRRVVRTRREGRLTVCEVVYAEVAPAFLSHWDLDNALHALGVELDPIGAEATWLAGQKFKTYRDAGGPRQHLIPDFLIAAHAGFNPTRCGQGRGYLSATSPTFRSRPQANRPLNSSRHIRPIALRRLRVPSPQR